jgi:hypothetical protein
MTRSPQVEHNPIIHCFILIMYTVLQHDSVIQASLYKSTLYMSLFRFFTVYLMEGNEKSVYMKLTANLASEN